MLYKLELDMGKITVEVKAIIDAKQNKCLKELTSVREAKWPDVDTDITIWEVIVGIEPLPLGESDCAVKVIVRGRREKKKRQFKESNV